MSRDLRAGILALSEALSGEGPRPDVHREIMARHRAEWPTLWAAIDKIMTADRTDLMDSSAVTLRLSRDEFYDVLVALQIADTFNPLAERYERLRLRLAAEDDV